MPSPPAASSRCSFEGTARAIHLRGEGAAVLVERAAFSDGHAAKVELLGASIGSRRSPVLEHPDALEPINMNEEGAPYDVTYSAGPPIKIQIGEGGKAGLFHGALEGAPPACASARGCEIVWSGAKKTIVLHRADASPMKLTRALPVEELDPTAPQQPVVHEVTLHGARGKLRCSDRDRPIEGDWQWTAGKLQMLSLQPIRLEAEGLGVTLENEAPPVSLSAPNASILFTLMATPGGRAVLLVGAAILVASAALGLFRRRLRPAAAQALEQAPNAPIDVFYSYAPEDEELCKKLEKHLRVLERRGTMRGFSPRRVSAGEEWKGIVDARLNEAKVILLLVSSDFMDSDYCWDVEVKRAMERHKAGDARVIPIILRPCQWQEAPFGELSALPEGGKSVTEWPSIDDALNDVAAAVKAAVASIRAGRRASAA